VVSVALARWSVGIQDAATQWLADEEGARVYGVDWSSATATIEVTTGDGEAPPIDDLQKAVAEIVPGFVGVVVDVGQGVEIPVQ
jgi:hypothetical protein